MTWSKPNLKPKPFDPKAVWLFRIVPLDVIKELFEVGQLCPPEEANLKSYENVTIARPNMLVKRKTRLTPNGATLHQHVAFYFAPRSPMLFSFYRKHQANVDYPYERIVYLMMQVKDLIALGGEFFFSDVNAVLKYANFSQDLSELDDFLDFDLLESRYFKRDDDPRRSQRRQAEFLYRGCVPTHSIQTIGCHNAEVKAEIDRMKLPVKVVCDTNKKLYF